MKLAITEHVYELSIDGVPQTQELYANSRVAIDLAMQNLCEEYDAEKPSFYSNSNDIHVVGPLFNACRVPGVSQWTVEIMKEGELIRIHLLQLRKIPVIIEK